jgi:hypothetical protein
MSSSLVTHCGARAVTRTELDAVKAPEPTATWFPLAHRAVLERVEASLRESGFVIERAQHALARHDNRYFGVLDLTTPLVSGVSLSVGVRNSTDKSLPIGFAAGSRVFVCDNLAFSSEVKVARKHTRFGEQRFNEAMVRAVQGLTQFRAAEAARIKKLQLTDVRELDGDGLLLRLWEKGVLTSPTQLRCALGQWRKPDHDEFQDRTLWSLFNAATYALADRRATNPGRFATATLALNDLLGQVAGVDSADAHAALSA